ncbi:hypothetical protein LTR50_002906 [Elasticomyces elasticus]|nr:hypothetical protein LTR50_002906 [Elasticomyces elasticus]
MHADDVLGLNDFFQELRLSNISLDDIRYSRIHKAILDISGKATRWPSKLIDRCDAIIDIWQAKYGDLSQLGTMLYEPGGRLHGICKPEDTSCEALLMRWLRTPGISVIPSRARRHGDLGFKPGDWWINPMFAFKDGIIDSGDPHGGIVADAVGAYAVLLTDSDELSGPGPNLFRYRTRTHDRGRYRMTSARWEARFPLRVLRSDSLRSLWAPRAGVRYDGLHTVRSWSVTYDTVKKEYNYDITLERLPGETPMTEVMVRPWAEEVEDYKEYKRLRHQAHERRWPAKQHGHDISPVQDHFQADRLDGMISP